MKQTTWSFRNQWALVLLLLTSIAVVAQQPTAKPFHPGPVWAISYVKTDYGMDDRYLSFLADTWKKEQEMLKKAGYVLDYKVITTEWHGQQDYNVILMIEFKDLASLEANEDKMESMANQMVGGEKQAETAAQDRGSYRTVIGERLGREIILSPR